MALSDIYMIQDFQSFTDTGEQILNNYFYRRLGTGGSAADLLEGFAAGDHLLEVVAGMQVDNVVHVERRCLNLGNLTDFATDTVNVTGADTSGDMLPLHDAINFTLKVDTRAVRPGSHRISGIPEGASTNGLVVSSGYIDLINLVVSQMSAIIVSSDDSYTPIVVKRVRLEPDADHPRVRYRLPEDDGELVFGNVTAAAVNLLVSHQVSRGNGR